MRKMSEKAQATMQHSLNTPVATSAGVTHQDSASMSVLDETASIRDKTLADHGMTLGKMVGSGGQGAVYRATCEGGDTVAIKILHKLAGNEGAAQRAQVKAEVKMLCEIAHERVLRIIRWFEDKKYFYIVTELIDGQDLFDVAASRTFTENEILLLCGDIVEALQAMHAMGIAHRDVKLENVLLDSSTFRATLIDFGFACRVNDVSAESPRQFPGTLKYQAPEVVQRHTEYDPCQADMWALGVLAYTIICGEYPFTGESKKELAASICRAKVCFNGPVWKRVTPDAMALIKLLLSPEPEERPTAAEVDNFLNCLMAERLILAEAERKRLHAVARPTSNLRRSAGAPKFEPLDFAPVATRFSTIAHDIKHNCASPKLTVSPRLMGLFSRHGRPVV